tara:strand:- start:3581 stop:6898 length:3318 start_codon:yes stop_codon:yes gene_type:complete
MSSGKNLKIVDIELTRLKGANDAAGGVKDRFRFTTKRYYHNFLAKQARDDVIIIKKSDRLIYGNNPPVNIQRAGRPGTIPEAIEDQGNERLRYSNSPIAEIHFAEASERCTSKIYEKRQSVRIVGNGSFIRNDTQWRSYILGGAYQGPAGELETGLEAAYGSGLQTGEVESVSPGSDKKVNVDSHGRSGLGSVDSSEASAQIDYNQTTNYPQVIKTEEVYYDHCFSLSLPFSKRETELLYGNVGSVYGNVDYVYNFLQEDYESSIVGKQVSEPILPNIYTLMAAFDQDTNVGMNENIKRHVTLDNSLPLPVYRKMKSSKFSGNVFSNRCAVASPPTGMNMEYFRDWSLLGLERYLSTNRNAAVTPLEKKFANILIPEKNIHLINQYNDSKEMFPMYADISFTTDTSTEIAEALSNLNLNCSLMKSMYELLTTPTDNQLDAGIETEGVPPPTEDGHEWGGATGEYLEEIVTGQQQVQVPGAPSAQYSRSTFMGDSGNAAGGTLLGSSYTGTSLGDPIIGGGSSSPLTSGRYSKSTENLSAGLGSQTAEGVATAASEYFGTAVDAAVDAAADPCMPSEAMPLYKNTFITQADTPTMAPGSTACSPKMSIKSNITQQSYRMMDLNEWMNYFHSNLGAPLATSGVFFGLRQKGMDLAQNPTTEYEKNFLMMILKSKIQTIVQNNMRSFDDIFDGDLAYSETIMYRIAKYRGTGGTPIQNYWISNSNKIDMLNFVDTQVKYNKEYRYVVYAYQVVLGTKYAYKNISISKTITEDPKVCVELFDIKTGQPVSQRVPFDGKINPVTKITKMIPVTKKQRYIAEFDAVVRPSVKVLEIPYMEFSAYIIDSPPMPPDINIVPYLHITNKINIFMNNGVGKETIKSTLINPIEAKFMQKYRKAKGLQPGELVTYESDDRPSNFLIFRKAGKKPTSYADFRGRLHRNVNVTKIIPDNPNEKEQVKGSFSSIAINDNILPNKKYYYTFKCVDYHGNISNPSPVYEVEIVEEKGSSYFLMQAVSFEKDEPRQPTITGKRLLHIAPNISQRLINEEASGFDEATSAKQLRNRVVLGLNDVGLWKKDFKIRLTSTKTGKKLDLNIKFIPQHKRTKSDFQC